MNDDFLYKYRPPVRKAFADSLYRRLASSELEQRGQVRSTGWSARRWALPAVAALTALVLMLAVWEPARAAALDWIKMVAGFRVEERETSPIQTEPATAPVSAPVMSTTGPASAGIVVTTEPTVYIIPTVALPEALQNPPFAFELPGWAPEGYTLDQDVAIGAARTWVAMRWSHTDNREIELLVEAEYNGYNLPAGVDSSEEIEIHGEPALLVRGFWNAEHQWDPRRGITLDWMQAGRHYRLSYFEREALHNELRPIAGDMEAITADLARMAESVP